MINFILSLLVVALCGYLGFKGDRWCGDGRKALGQVTLGAAISIPVLFGLVLNWGILSMGLSALGVVLGTFALSWVAAGMLRRWFLWGATFMNDVQKEKEQNHLYIYSIAEKICGFEWGNLPNDKLVILKMTMWMVHHFIAGSLCAVLIAVSNLTILPFAMIVLVGLARSYIYRREHLMNEQEQLEPAEKKSGLMTYALMALSRM